MENLQVQNYGCQELDATIAQETNGGFLTIGLFNNNGVVSTGISLDTKSLVNGLGNLGGGLGGIGGGTGGANNLLGSVSSLLNSLLGGINLGGGGLLG
ncbi:hypothetical protein MKQ68_23055 [Chitinophaga horti]|uniref:Bacteriocin-type signal sequence-containing protein n=1 Tax=Chitinophaga horti TaxID=2920382 RepID=A0ABY6IZW9_9BACT|nr:hypothetical protein [Chitinophaga horti]UYQ92963.1 hypothetical protein MKQ68_23055 [Chitinophaga horti]